MSELSVVKWNSVFWELHFLPAAESLQTPDLEPQNKELEPQAPDLEPQNKELEPQTPDLEPQNKELEPQAPDLEPQNKELEPRKPRIWSRKTRNWRKNPGSGAAKQGTGAKTPDLEPQNKELEHFDEAELDSSNVKAKILRCASFTFYSMTLLFDLF